MSNEQVQLEPRVRPLPIEEFDPELREMVGGEAATPAELGPLTIHAQRPGLAKALLQYHGVLWNDRLLSDRLHELVRLHIAFFNQCRSCMAMRYPAAIEDGLTEELVCSLERPYEAEDLSEADRAALRYAELMATDHLSIDTAVYDELRRHFSEPEIVELGTSVAFCIGFGRLAASWHVVEHLPERFQEEGVVTPWA
jgi:alkylhydroperoxidase family enzyme